MRKFIKAIALASAMLMAATAFAACGSDDKSSSKSASSVSDVSVTQADVHKITTEKGIEIANDSAIDTSDSAAESTISAYLSKNTQLKDSIESSAAGNATANIYAKGNAMVVECTLTVMLDDGQTSAIKNAGDSVISSLKPMLSSMRSDVGADNMVMVVAYLSMDGSYITGGVAK